MRKTCVLSVTCLVALAQSALAETKTWVGVLPEEEGATTALASVATNWSPQGVPADGDDIVLDGTSVVNLTWDGASEGVPATVKSWTQTADYSGVVTVPTLKDSAFSTLTVLEDCVLMGGKWTHSEDLESSSGSKVGLFLSVGGNLKTGTGFTFDAKGKGYKSCGGPSPGSGGDKTKYQNGIAHGGEGGWDFDWCKYFRYGAVYGSLTQPNELGSSGKDLHRGGGLVHIEVSGDFVHEGKLTVQGATGSDTAVVGTGGSVFVKARSLTGAGEINACCGTSSTYAPGSGGGRIAVYALETPSYETFLEGFTGTIKANSWRSGASKKANLRMFGGPGTIYVKTASDSCGFLILDNANTGNSSSYDEFASATVNSTETWELDRIYLRNSGRLAIAGIVRLPGPEAIISDGAARNHIRFDGGSLEFTDFPEGSDYCVSAYDLVIRTPSEIPYSLRMSAGRNLRFLKPVKLTVRRLRVGGVKFAKGVYTTAQINAMAGVTVADNSIAASEADGGLVEVLENSLGIAIYVR